MNQKWGEAGDERFDPPGDGMFALWRAVFSLVHVDGYLAEEERQYIQQVMDVFSFLPEQKRIVEGDIKNPSDVLALFKAVEGLERRRQFFRLARTVIWCDGFLHEDESAALDDIQDYLGEGAHDYESELRWLLRKPDIHGLDEGLSAGGRMMKTVVSEMATFYKARNNE